jgi:hypothetical protein
MGEWRKLHSGALHDLYPSPDIIRQIKSMGMRWVGDVARMGERRNVYRVLVGKPKGKSHMKDQGVDWNKMDLMGMWSGFTWLRIGITGGLL